MPDQPKMSQPKTVQPKKFNAERATRLSLLTALCLTAGIGTTIYAPLAHFKPSNFKSSGATIQSVPALPVRAEQVQPVAAAQPPTSRLAPLLSNAESRPTSQIQTPGVGSPAGATFERPARAELAPAAPHDDPEDGESDEQSGSVPAVRLVRVAARASGLTGHAAKRVGVRRPVRQVAPAPTRPRAAPQPAAAVSRQAAPRIVRRSVVPVIAATAPS